jgi:hypothetical protein
LGKSPSVIFSQANVAVSGVHRAKLHFMVLTGCLQVICGLVGARGRRGRMGFAPGLPKTVLVPWGYNKRLIFNRFYKTNLE